jgi:putative CocE/NonD family hydrolase
MSDDALYAVEIRYDVRIPMRDGLLLSANVFMPVARAANERFPAILEMLPYRKDDWRHCSDHQRMTYFAQRGYVGCRLDIRGTGSSPGIARDEYTPEETRDGYDAVGWLAAQNWCNGNIGMWGISYGGFTALQVAMLRPPALKAIIPMYATDDRYTDDVHYNGGCLTASDLAQYAISMVAMNAMPPRAEYVGHDWAAQWKARLEQTPPWLIEWLRQQTDGPYWRVAQRSGLPDRADATANALPGGYGAWPSPPSPLSRCGRRGRARRRLRFSQFSIQSIATLTARPTARALRSAGARAGRPTGWRVTCAPTRR